MNITGWKLISVSELRETLPEVVHRVLAKKETYIITKHGFPFAKLESIPREEALEMLGEFKPRQKKKKSESSHEP